MGICTVDLTPRTWGCDYTFWPADMWGDAGEVIGWHTPPPHVDDWLLLRNGDGSTRYRVVAVEVWINPPDMFKAQVVFDPRPT